LISYNIDFYLDNNMFSCISNCWYVVLRNTAANKKYKIQKAHSANLDYDNVTLYNNINNVLIIVYNYSKIPTLFSFRFQIVKLKQV